MGSYSKVPKGDLGVISDFITVGACVKCTYLAESYFYQKYVRMKGYV